VPAMVVQTLVRRRHVVVATMVLRTQSVCVTPPNNFNKFGGVTTLQDNNKTKAIENIGINLKGQSKRKQLPTFNLNQRV
jgi:hypothetical protein